MNEYLPENVSLTVSLNNKLQATRCWLKVIKQPPRDLKARGEVKDNYPRYFVVYGSIACPHSHSLVFLYLMQVI
jgi:hypothetical protein